MIELLPLERNAILTEINKEIDAAGGSFIVSRGLTVDRAASVYELATYIYAKFGKMDVPFGTVLEKIQDCVQGYIEHYDRIRAGKYGGNV